MGEELREGDVQKGDVSIAEYHLFRLDREVGDDESAATRLKELQEYNDYDCLSTLRLRDWLLDAAEVRRGGARGSRGRCRRAARVRARAGASPPDPRALRTGGDRP